MLSFIVIPGILLINQSLDLHYRLGFILGIIAAFMAALFTIFNKKYVIVDDSLFIFDGNNIIRILQVLTQLFRITYTMISGILRRH